MRGTGATPGADTFSTQWGCSGTAVVGGSPAQWTQGPPSFSLAMSPSFCPHDHTAQCGSRGGHQVPREGLWRQEIPTQGRSQGVHTGMNAKEAFHNIIFPCGGWQSW